jgi:uncharacterized protein
MKIAIIGSGIAGNTLAYHLHPQHDITVFEASHYVGGHTQTHDIDVFGQPYRVDTGFIVFNDKTYPHFIALMEAVGVEWQPSNMSFSVRDEASGFEYNGTSLNSLFAQRRNLFNPSFYGMLMDILKFNKQALALLESNSEIQLGDFLAQGGYGDKFIQHYIIPMGAAIWSTDAQRMLAFPARFFVRFFHHHGFLTVNKRPQWRTIVNGSSSYLDKLTAGFADRIKLNTPIVSVKRTADRVMVKPLVGEAVAFDYVFFACHSDQALAMLGQDASPQEREVLGAIPYQEKQCICTKTAA